MNFDEVFELFFTYKLYLKSGIAYITSQQLLAVIAPRFRENLASSMTVNIFVIYLIIFLVCPSTFKSTSG